MPIWSKRNRSAWLPLIVHLACLCFCQWGRVYPLQWLPLGVVVCVCSVRHSACWYLAAVTAHSGSMKPQVAAVVSTCYDLDGGTPYLTLKNDLNPLNLELKPICYLLALLGAHHFLHVSRIRVKLLTFRRLMSYIYGTPILDVYRSHTTTHHSR